MSMNPNFKRIALVLAEAAIVLVIVALLCANWIPILFGGRGYRAAP